MATKLSSPYRTLESFSIEEAVSHADQETLVIFDIDETLIYNVFDNMQGLRFTPLLLSPDSKQFVFDTIFSANAEKALSLTSSLPKELATPLLTKYFEDQILRIFIRGDYWENAKKVMAPTPVETETAQIVHSLQESKIPTIACTARSWYAMNYVVSQLLAVNISFSKSCIHNGSVVQKAAETTGFGYKDGILTLILKDGLDFSETKNKGNVLVAFLSAIGSSHKKVLFIDNCQKTVGNVVEACSKQKIPVTGIWYREHEKKRRSLTEAEKEELLCFSRNSNWWQIDHDQDDIRQYLSKHAPQHPSPLHPPHPTPLLKPNTGA